MIFWKEKALEHAKELAPNESVGLVLNSRGKTVYYPCKNISDTPENTFAIHPKDFLKARSKGKLQYIVHSHPAGGLASKTDINACKATKLKWYIYRNTLDEWLIINP